MKTSGVDTHNQKNRRRRIFVKGTESVDPYNAAVIFMMKKRVKKIQGNPNAVAAVHFCQLFPLKVLYNRADTNPAANPINW
mmetsp:Transcript_38198/g.74758  ORF Transcript_38198/g.74758 Transcript_38198/m.74758 type:complete len:81 (+) Transcript_38198:506-748(+)